MITLQSTESDGRNCRTSTSPARLSTPIGYHSRSRCHDNNSKTKKVNNRLVVSTTTTTTTLVVGCVAVLQLLSSSVAVVDAQPIIPPIPPDGEFCNICREGGTVTLPFGIIASVSEPGFTAGFTCAQADAAARSMFFDVEQCFLAQALAAAESVCGCVGGTGPVPVMPTFAPVVPPVPTAPVVAPTLAPDGSGGGTPTIDDSFISNAPAGTFPACSICLNGNPIGDLTGVVGSQTCQQVDIMATAGMFSPVVCAIYQSVTSIMPDDVCDCFPDTPAPTNAPVVPTVAPPVPTVTSSPTPNPTDRPTPAPVPHPTPEPTGSPLAPPSDPPTTTPVTPTPSTAAPSADPGRPLCNICTFAEPDDPFLGNPGGIIAVLNGMNVTCSEAQAQAFQFGTRMGFTPNQCATAQSLAEIDDRCGCPGGPTEAPVVAPVTSAPTVGEPKEFCVLCLSGREADFNGAIAGMQCKEVEQKGINSELTQSECVGAQLLADSISNPCGCRLEPSVAPTPAPTPMPSPAPTTSAPSASPSVSPSAIPSSIPSNVPSAIPSEMPSSAPSALPSESPSDEPSAEPSEAPSAEPSAAPSVAPSATPSASPSDLPSTTPSRPPSPMPSAFPSPAPSGTPSALPSVTPSAQPSVTPSSTPSAAPSGTPSAQPSVTPSSTPSAQPSVTPSAQPSVSPSSTPSAAPSVEPSSTPSVPPTAMPSASPSVTPSGTPSAAPSAQPSVSPSVTPSAQPSVTPSGTPSAQPSVTPSSTPSAQPSVTPSSTPSAAPSVEPSTTPSRPPSPMPSAFPSPEPSLSAEPSMTPSISNAPTVSAAPTTDIFCIVCGPGEQVCNPTGFVGNPLLTCDRIEFLGVSGRFNPAECMMIQDNPAFRLNCDCQPFFMCPTVREADASAETAAISESMAEYENEFKTIEDTILSWDFPVCDICGDVTAGTSQVSFPRRSFETELANVLNSNAAVNSMECKDLAEMSSMGWLDTETCASTRAQAGPSCCAQS